MQVECSSDAAFTWLVKRWATSTALQLLDPDSEKAAKKSSQKCALKALQKAAKHWHGHLLRAEVLRLVHWQSFGWEPHVRQWLRFVFQHASNLKVLEVYSNAHWPVLQTASRLPVSPFLQLRHLIMEYNAPQRGLYSMKTVSRFGRLRQI